MTPQNPNGGFQFPRMGRYTGKTLGGSTVSADIAPGGILQQHAEYTTGSILRNAAGTAVADDAYAYGQPTAGWATPFAVISHEITRDQLALLNAKNDTSDANLRDGGALNLVSTGYTKALVKANCVGGKTRLAPVAGQFYLAGASGTELLYSLVADSTTVSITTNTETAFSSTYTIPAASLQVGDVLWITGKAVAVTANSTDTMVIKLYIGSTLVLATGTVNFDAAGSGNDDIAVFSAFVTIRTIGNSGTWESGGNTYIGTRSAAAGAADIPSGSSSLTDASQAINTNTTNDISVKVTFPTTTGTNAAKLVQLNVIKFSGAAALGGGEQGPFAIAMETVDNSAAAALTKILIVQPPL